MNKKISLIIALIFCNGLLVKAQSVYKLFKVDTQLGYATPISSDAYKGGFCLSIEPKFNITDNIAVGLKSEASVLANYNSYDDSYGKFSVVGSTLLTGEYYLGQKGVRPFLGIAAGLYRSIIIDSDVEYEYIGAERRFGFAPRLGLQIWHFRLVGELNMVKNANYLSVKIGTTWGGGKRK